MLARRLCVALAVLAVLADSGVTHASPPVDADAVWTAFVDALERGDRAGVRALATERGYARLVQDHEGEDIADHLRALGRSWRQLEHRFTERTPTRLHASIGASVKASWVSFIRKGGAWKLDGWGGPGK